MKKSGMLVGKREVNLCSRLSRASFHADGKDTSFHFKTDEIGSIISC